MRSRDARGRGLCLPRLLLETMRTHRRLTFQLPPRCPDLWRPWEKEAGNLSSQFCGHEVLVAGHRSSSEEHEQENWRETPRNFAKWEK